jgi:DNA-binding GntR family transcriptional regulator
VEELRVLVDAPDSAVIYPEYLNLDHTFHQKLVCLAGSLRLSQAHDRENMHAQMARIRYRYAARDLTTAQAEHEQLLAALEERDAAQARRVIDAHLKRAKCSLLADMGVTIEDAN